MQSRRRKYFYGLAVGLALAALLIDRALDSGPDQAAAASAPKKTPKNPARSTPPAGPAKTDPLGTTPDDPAVNALARLPDAPEARDLFAAKDFTARQQALATNTADDPQADPAVEFARSHHLQATLQDGPDRVALIDGRILRPGQTLGDFQLVLVEPFRASFRLGDLETTLLLKNNARGPEKSGPKKSPGNAAGRR